MKFLLAVIDNVSNVGDGRSGVCLFPRLRFLRITLSQCPYSKKEPAYERVTQNTRHLHAIHRSVRFWNREAGCPS